MYIGQIDITPSPTGQGDMTHNRLQRKKAAGGE